MFQDLLITITGTKDIYVENYKSILDYKDNLVALQGKKETMVIHGEDLLIEYFAVDGMKISGCISSIEFCKLTKHSNRR